MIPKRVSLRGFLSYREEQEVLFDSSSLWMLFGLNGSGKSSVFDAVTYALFGHHRGGHQQAIELINKDSNNCAVEFDFTQDGELYRARRTLARDGKGGTRGTQQILRSKDEGKSWLPVEDTNLKRPYDNWIAEHIGLNFETFTSSVLLLQGRAEKLLDSTAKGRFEVLAGIVDLERYQRLHEKADGQRKQLKANVEALKAQLEHHPEVSELELAAAEGRITDAEDGRKQRHAEVERWQGVEFQAQRWSELQTKLSGLQLKWQQFQTLVAEAEVIEKDLVRLRELRDVLPHVENVVKQRQQAKLSEGTIAGLLNERVEIDARIAERSDALDQARQKRTKLQQRGSDEDRRLHEITEELRKLEPILERVKNCERSKQILEAQEKELAALPKSSAQSVADAEQSVEALTTLDRAVPLLERFANKRDLLRQMLAAASAKAKEEQTIKVRGEALKTEHDEAKKQADEATTKRQETDAELAAARALFTQIEESWNSFKGLEGAQLCRACGQPLTPGHLKKEKAKRERELAEARERNGKAATAQRTALKDEKTLQDKCQAKFHDLEATRDKFREARDGVQHARKDAERYREECQHIWGELPESLRIRISPTPPDDWTKTTYPSSEDLASVSREARGLETARKALVEAREAHNRWSLLQDRVAMTRSALQALQTELPRDVAALRRKQVSFETERKTVADNLKAAREEERALQAETDRLLAERDNAQKLRADRDAKIKAEEATRNYCVKAVESALKMLPLAWLPLDEDFGLTQVHRFKDEREQLVERHTEERYEQLQGARHGGAALKQQIAVLEADCAQVPEEARRDLSEVQALLGDARKRSAEADEAFRKAQNELDKLNEMRKQRTQLQARVLEAEKEFKVLVQLSQLLGRDRLQLHLVRQAERQIVDHANAVLDRLSGGQLFLRLSGTDGEEAGSEQALQLEAYNRTTGGQAINVAFLSGSQRFRVAVSLALGIGQYASRQHRPIEAVIIDEGFGCLDRYGRQVMIQELQNLRGQLHCILLVSHQEEFADAFTDSYHFELNEGSTKVTKIQR
jgi:DNA repair protein SbcC/Rad50